MAKTAIEVPPGQSVLISVGFFADYYNRVRILDAQGEVVRVNIAPPDSEPIEIDLEWNNDRRDPTDYPYRTWKSPKNTSDEMETYYLHVQNKEIRWDDPDEPDSPWLESEEKVLRQIPPPRQRLELGYDDAGGDKDYNDAMVGVNWLSD